MNSFFFVETASVEEERKGEKKEVSEEKENM